MQLHVVPNYTQQLGRKEPVRQHGEDKVANKCTRNDQGIAVHIIRFKSHVVYLSSCFFPNVAVISGIYAIAVPLIELLNTVFYLDFMCPAK